MNRKIKNTTPVVYDNIHFKSTIEKTVYNTLIQQGITPVYEGVTYTLSDKIRPCVTPYYVRRKTKEGNQLSLDMSPIDDITYTPDFTFRLNGIFVIMEVKGFVNNVYPTKKNLFRKLLEFVEEPTMFFEVRSKKEVLKSLEIIKMESPQIQKFRNLITKLPEKDIASCNRYLDRRDFVGLQQVVDLAVRRIEKDREKEAENQKFADIDLDSLYILQSELVPITLHEEDDDGDEEFI